MLNGSANSSIIQVAKEYKTSHAGEDNLPLSEQIVRYMNEHSLDTATAIIFIRRSGNIIINH